MPGKRGPKHKPTKLLHAIGSGELRKRGREPTPVVGEPTMPDGMPPLAEALWPRLIALVREMGLVSQADEFALGAFCVSYALWADAVEDIQKNGRVYEVETKSGGVMRRANPSFSQMLECRKEMDRIGACYGLTPSARAALAVGIGPSPTDTAHHFRKAQ